MEDIKELILDGEDLVGEWEEEIDIDEDEREGDGDDDAWEPY